MSFHRLIACFLAAILTYSPQVVAQQTPAQQSTPPQAKPPADPAENQLFRNGLRLLVLEGQNAINSTATKSAISPVVQVLDGMEQPVEGAEVTFEAPMAGPGGSFGGQQTITVRTDYTGQATARFSPNDATGPFTIRVKASMASQVAEVRIRQTNDQRPMIATVPPPPKPWYKDWKWWTAIGAGAGAGVGTGIYLYNRNQTSTITIAPGTVTIGGPR